MVFALMGLLREGKGGDKGEKDRGGESRYFVPERLSLVQDSSSEARRSSAGVRSISSNVPRGRGGRRIGSRVVDDRNANTRRPTRRGLFSSSDNDAGSGCRHLDWLVVLILRDG